MEKIDFIRAEYLLYLAKGQMSDEEQTNAGAFVEGFSAGELYGKVHAYKESSKHFFAFFVLLSILTIANIIITYAGGF